MLSHAQQLQNIEKLIYGKKRQLHTLEWFQKLTNTAIQKENQELTELYSERAELLPEGTNQMWGFVRD